jgi:glycerol-3-phosphate dehydrogenase
MKNKSLKEIVKAVKKVSPDFSVSLERNCVVLRGETDSWDKVIEAGQAAVSKRFLGVINDIKLKNFTQIVRAPKISDNALEGRSPDVLIIGAGIVGAAIAREIARYKLSALIVDKGYDVATAASSRNDGCVHVGIDLHKGQQKLYYNGRGNKLFPKLTAELGVDFEQRGHVLLLYKKAEKLFAPLFKLRAKQNGIEGVRYMSRDELLAVEPKLPSWCSGGIYMPSGGIVSPYKLTVALAENAVENGVELSLNTVVKSMEVRDGEIKSVLTNRGRVYPKLVINAAGVYSDIIADMAGDRTFTVHPRKGTNIILDKKAAGYVRTSMAKSPFSFVPDAVENLNKSTFKNFLAAATSKSHTKGGGVVHTIDNNVLVGPTATEVPDREDYGADKADIDMIMAKQKVTAQSMNYGDVITYFSGTRAATYEEDFVVRKGIFTKNIIEAAGIQSPGITAAPAIGVETAAWAAEMLGAGKNENFNPIRKPIPHLASMSFSERDEFIKNNPDYGVIVCRCEEVSRGEIIDALNSPVPVDSIDAIKRRVRPGMGRCQGGFCSPLVAGIISEVKNIPLTEVKKGGEQSEILISSTK